MPGVCRHISEHLQVMARKVFDHRVLPAAQRYVASAPLEFLKLVLCADDSDQGNMRLQVRTTWTTRHKTSKETVPCVATHVCVQLDCTRK